MNPSEMQQMLERAQQMQAQLQQKMKSTTAEASVGGGAVTVKVNGEKTVLAVRIDAELVKSGDVEMMQDLVAAAVNEANRKAEAELKGSLGGLLGGMGLPGIF